MAARAVWGGGLVAHATEGVWGLACDPFDVNAVIRLLELKERHPNKGLIVIGAHASVFAEELAALSVEERDTVQRSWPGANTWVVPNVRFPTWITGDRDTVAVRVPGHAQARDFCAACGGLLVSTSANRSGRPAALGPLAVRRDFPDLDDLLPGRVDQPGAPSTIRTTSGVTLR